MISLLLIGRSQLNIQPTHGSYHGKKQMKLSVLRHLLLDKKCIGPELDAYDQLIDHHFNGVIVKQSRVIIVSRQGMPIRNKQEICMLILKLDPVLQHFVVVPQMQTNRRPHSRQDTLLRIHR